MLFGSTDRIIERFKIEGEEAVGFDGKGEEITRVPFTEPTWIRKAFDQRHGAYRHNTS